MKIIYDSKAEAHKRIIILDENNEQIGIAGCFKIEIETTVDGKPREHLNFSRWGTAKERSVKHKAIQEAIDAAKGE